MAAFKKRNFLMAYLKSTGLINERAFLIKKIRKLRIFGTKGDFNKKLPKFEIPVSVLKCKTVR